MHANANLGHVDSTPPMAVPPTNRMIYPFLTNDNGDYRTEDVVNYSYRYRCASSIRSKLSAIDAVVRRIDNEERAGWTILHCRDDG